MIGLSMRKLFGFEDRVAKRHKLRGLFRPRMEALEERSVPAIFYVDNTVTGAPGPGNGTFTPTGGSQTAQSGLTQGVDLFATIGAAVAAAGPNDTINVADGTYAESFSVPAAKTGLIIRGNQVGVDARARSATESIVTNSTTPVGLAANNVTFNGFTVSGATSGAAGFGILMGAGNSGYQVLNNIVQSNLAGISLANTGATQAVIRFNLIQNNNNPGAASGHGIYTDQFNAGGTLSNVLIDSNNFINNGNSVNGGSAIGFSSTSAAAPATGITISNNVFDGNARAVYAFILTSSSITNNDLLNANWSATADIRIFEGVNGLTITGNRMDAGAGFALRVTNAGTGLPDATGVTFARNSVGTYGAATAVDVVPADYNGILNASGNWWNTTLTGTGPTAISNAELGLIEARTSGAVRVGSFLNSGTDANATAPGFQLPATTENWVPRTGTTTGLTRVLGSINDGVGSSAAGMTVRVAADSFTENVLVDKALRLLGDDASAAGNGTTDVIVYPAVDVSNVLTISASNVEVANLTVDGNNPALTGVNSSIEGLRGILATHPTAALTGLNIHHNAVRNLWRRGIQSDTYLAGFDIHDNQVSTVSGDAAAIGIFNYGGGGLPGTAQIRTNTITGSTVAIQGQQSAGMQVTGNIITMVAGGNGIVDSNPGTGSPPPVGATENINGNMITGGNVNSGGVLVVNQAMAVQVQGNNVTTPGTGLGAFGSFTANTTTFNTNTVNANGIGIQVTTDSLVNGNQNVAAIITSNIINNAATGILVTQVSGATATAQVTGNTLTGNTTGVNVDGGQLTLGAGNTISGGATGLRLSGASLGLAGLTLNNIVFTGQSGDYVTLANTALDNQVINGGAASYGGVVGSSATAAQGFVIETKLTHAPDNPTLGLINFDNNNIYVSSVGVTSTTPSATDNDYLRIKNAVVAATTGSVINLQGTFNWVETNAAASWAAGNDGVVGTAADNFSILLPANLNGVTVTAPGGLGTATIQGPGDLASADLEGVFVADGGDNQNWTFSNLNIFDFDLSIAMFFGAGGADAFNGTQIVNNRIRIPVDLNAVAAPADIFQNIGIHYSFGINQTISGNVFDIDGTGVSNGTNFSSSVGMQSNTGNFSVYNGLMITGNTINITGAQSANPSSILGIWENGHAHTSNITVSGNTFTNLAAGNNPALNLQRAFRVTSHSSATTTVAYSSNNVTGANIGFQWLAGQNFSGNQPVQLTSNTLTNVFTGVLLQSQGSATLAGNSVGVNATAGSIGVNVINGSSVGFGAGNTITGGATGLRVDGATSTIAPLTLNNTAFTGQSGDYITLANTALDNQVVNGTAASYGGVVGSAANASQAAAIENKITHEPDNATLGLIRFNSNVFVTPATTPSAGDNDYLRIKNAIVAATPGTIIQLSGTFNWAEPFAAASWALGNDGVADSQPVITGISGDDDYSIVLPYNVPNVTVTAASLGAATIQGPGDLAAVDLENVFFAQSDDGDIQGWTFSNLRIFDFDSAFMFTYGLNPGINTDAFNGLTITNNRIRVATDSAAEPFNVTFPPTGLQNIGINYAFGSNQTISNNIFDLTPGAGNNTSSVAIQSNSLGVAALITGLQITGNTINVAASATPADPGRILGIWENTGADGATITVSNNQFLGNAANTLTSGRLTAFQITSHSASTGTVTYSTNTIQNASTGFRWDPEPALVHIPGYLPVQLTGNTLTNALTGILVQNNGAVAFGAGNSVTGGTTGLVVDGAGSSISAAGLNNLAFSGQSGNYITLSTGAMDNLEINGTAATFGGAGLTGAAMSIAQNYATEDKILHAVDNNALGFVRVRLGNVFVTPTSGASPIIQRAINDVAVNGNTINIQQSAVPYTGGADATVSPTKGVTLSPGSGPGQVTISGNLRLDANDALFMEINGTDPLTQFDNFVITGGGTVTLGGANLNVSASISPFTGTFAIISNDLADPVVGQFAQGGTVSGGSVNFSISYAGGTGNDVVLTAQAPPGISGLQVGPVVASLPNQRSRIDQLIVTFGESLGVHPDSAFSLTRTTNSTAVALTVTWNADFSRATLTFSGSNVSGGSLIDGRYRLTVDGNQLITTSGVAIDADGDRAPGGTLVFDFHRLFGDSDGDADTDFTDLARFRLALGGPSTTPFIAYNPAFDSDGDGDVDFTDLAQFRLRLGTVLPA